MSTYAAVDLSLLTKEVFDLAKKQSIPNSGVTKICTTGYLTMAKSQGGLVGLLEWESQDIPINEGAVIFMGAAEQITQYVAANPQLFSRSTFPFDPIAIDADSKLVV